MYIYIYIYIYTCSFFSLQFYVHRSVTIKK